MVNRKQLRKKQQRRRRQQRRKHHQQRKNKCLPSLSPQLNDTTENQD